MGSVASQKKIEEPKPPKELGPTSTLIGQFALQLRNANVLLIVPLVVAGLIPARGWLLGSGWPEVVNKAGELVGWWKFLDLVIPIAPIAIALALALDKIADRYQKRQASLDVDDMRAQLRAAEDTAAAAVGNLTALLGAAIRAATKRGEAHTTLVEELAETLTQQAAKSIGYGTRATYYSLSFDDCGHRILGSPVHAVEFPRQDKPRRAFSEHDQPDLSIWRMMDGADEEPDVRHSPESIDDLDWLSKKYSTFYSIPVKSLKTQFGMLSVNNTTDGSIGMTQRFVILAMARAFALVLASDQEAQTWLATMPANDSDGS